MADGTTVNMGWIKPEVGASRDSWGAKNNSNWDGADGIFKADGTGTSVGLNIGAGKTLNVAGTIVMPAGSVPPAAIADNSLVAAKVTFTVTDRILGRATAGAGQGEEITCNAQGRSLLAAADAAALRVIADAAGLSVANVFTATQTVQLSDDGAGAGPVLGLNRISLTPAAADQLGRIPFSGRDTAGNTLDYAAIVAMIADAADASEDGQLAIETVIAGALAKRFRFGNGLFAEGVTGGDKGAGTGNFQDVYIKGVKLGDEPPVGSVVQVTSSAFTGDQGVTEGNTIPMDDTIPQSSEGREIFTHSHTPQKATNKLKVDVSMTGFCNTGDRNVTVALFRDGQTSALAAGHAYIEDIDDAYTVSFTHFMNAPGTSAVVFRARLGLDEATGIVHAGGVYGGRHATSITVTEISA